MINRTQGLVLGFFLLAWVSLVVILATAPEVYDQALSLPTGDRRLLELGFLAALSDFIARLAVGVVRRWRWSFWLILIALLLGVLRVPVAILQLRGSWRPMAQPGTSCSKACSASFNSPLGLQWWPDTAAVASGGAD